MIETLIDLTWEPLITGVFLSTPFLLNFFENKAKKKKELENLSKEATEHIEAYKRKKLNEYYMTINQNVVSLPSFIEADKELKRSNKIG